VTGGAWTLVYDPHASVYHHEVDAQPDYFPVHSFLSFRLTRRPPPQFIDS
jgi:hypothetical protein